VPDQHRRRSEPRASSERAVDLAAIDHLADELLPALIAKLGATNLGEIEIREGDWKLRLRRPSSSGPNFGRRAGDRTTSEKPSRAQPGHEGHGHAPGALESHRTPATGGSNGADAPTMAAVGPGRSAEGRTDGSDDRSVATSPAVGVFQPASTTVAGAKVRGGDRLGIVEVLGVPHEVLAPADGTVATALVEGGHAVEYGQELVRIDLATSEASE
jgi:biotin carboxyl carrier protein